MAEILPDDPVARAKAIALKLTATSVPGEDPGAPAGQNGMQAPASESGMAFPNGITGRGGVEVGFDPAAVVMVCLFLGLP